MERRDLLAHVVTKFAPRQWENVASESLLYLFKRDLGSAAINTLLSSTAVRLGPVRWHSQASGAADDGIPDLVADDSQRRHVIIIESKFWAGLTPNQPLGYLRRQALQVGDSPDPRLHLFIAPARRV